MARNATAKPKTASTSAVLGGVVLVLVGVLCLVFPKATLTLIALVFGILFIVMGAADIAGYVKAGKNPSTDFGARPRITWGIIGGILKVILGLLIAVYPWTFMNVIPWIIGAVVIISALWQFSATVQLYKIQAPLWWTALISSVVTLILGILMITHTGWLSWLIGIFAIIRGLALCIQGKYTNEIVFDVK